MKNHINQLLNKKSTWNAFLINLAIGFLAFAWTILGQGGVFSLAGDFNSQQIPFTMHAQDMIRAGEWGFDYAIDLGSGFMGSMSFYLLGSPSFWLSMLVPSRYFMYAVGWLYVLKYAVAGAASYMWISRMTEKPASAMAGSIVYAFSGFMNENLLFYHFHDVVMLFPLLLVAMDDLVQKKRRGPFIFAVLINALCNYYFLVGEVIFLVIYFIVRYLIPDFKTNRKMFFSVLFEGVLGGVISMVLLWPAFLFVMQNPRVKVDYTGSNSLVFGAQRYLYILKALLFPGEVMSDQTAVISRNFSSCAAYLPMIGIVLVLAYTVYKREDWVTRLLKVCLVFACVPFLNAAFSAFAGLYCRWYYMPILIMSLASAKMLDVTLTESGEDRQEAEAPLSVRKAMNYAFIVTMLITSFFVLFLTLVKWNDNEPSLIHRPVLFVVYAAVSMGGTIYTYFSLMYLKKKPFRAFFIGLAVFATLTTAGNVLSYQMEHGKWSDDLYDEIRTSEDFVSEPAYRFATNENTLTLSHGFSATGNFCSTVSGSIFRFYESIGLERDVKSPDPPDGMYELVSSKYSIETEELTEEEAGKKLLVGTYRGKYHTYYEYADPTIPSIGYTYDSYMTSSEFLKLPKDNRTVYMLRTLVIPDEKEEEGKKVLVRFDPDTSPVLTSDNIEALSVSNTLECSEEFERSSSGFRSVITASAPKYAFYSIPNDEGWTAFVNGEEAEILDINGFMAVKVAEGRNEVEFRYETPGLTFGIIASLIGLAAAVIYILVSMILTFRRKRLAARPSDTEASSDAIPVSENVTLLRPETPDGSPSPEDNAAIQEEEPSVKEEVSYEGNEVYGSISEEE